MFEDDAHSEDDAHKPGVGIPRYIEVEPGIFRDIHDCSESEIETRVLSLMMKGKALIEQAYALRKYFEERC